MIATKLTTHEEHTLGIEDRVFRSDANWYWQARGCAAAIGPFRTRSLAEDDYRSEQYEERER